MNIVIVLQHEHHNVSFGYRDPGIEPGTSLTAQSVGDANH